MTSKFIVITSISGVTEAVKQFAKIKDWHVVVVGDKKTPQLDENPFPNVTFLSIEKQAQLGFSFYKVCPFNHYVRKNLGYLYALKQGATWIADTDDDNFPYDDWPSEVCEKAAIETVTGKKVVNIYSYFTEEPIWPRGLPLNLIRDTATAKLVEEAKFNDIGVWQGLADKEPDVDAIYRLAINKQIVFKKRPPLALGEGTYCPFNSQNTIWTSKESFPYLYIPLSVSFRFCDILRGYIAQRGLWALKSRLAFTSASVYQDRNAHDLMRDFIDEIPCYKGVSQVIEFLEAVTLKGDAFEDIVTIYEGLEKLDIVKESDIKGVKAFLEDF